MFNYLINTLPHPFINWLIGGGIFIIVSLLLLVFFVFCIVLNKLIDGKYYQNRNITISIGLLGLGATILFALIMLGIYISFGPYWDKMTSPDSYDQYHPTLATKTVTSISKYAIADYNDQPIKLTSLTKGKKIWNIIWVTDDHGHVNKFYNNGYTTVRINTQPQPKQSIKPSIKLVTITPKQRYRDLNKLHTQHQIIITMPIKNKSVN